MPQKQFTFTLFHNNVPILNHSNNEEYKGNGKLSFIINLYLSSLYLLSIPKEKLQDSCKKE